MGHDEHGPAYPEPKTDYEEVLEPSEPPVFMKAIGWFAAIILIVYFLFAR